MFSSKIQKTILILGQIKFSFVSFIITLRMNLIFLFLAVSFSGYCKMNTSPAIKAIFPILLAQTSFSVGGTVTLLGSGKSITLQNNAGNDLTISVNGPYSFTRTLSNSEIYALSILTQPSSQTCV